MMYNCTIAGFGGQGVMLMGNILAHAAIEENKKITYMPVYGVEMRGGTANCTVVISDQDIGSPVIQHPMSAIIMNQPSLEKYASRVKKGGLLAVNTSLISIESIKNVEEKMDVECLKVPTRELALEIGNAKLANMIMLGAAVRKCRIVKVNSLKKALCSALDRRYHHMMKMNILALERGAEFTDNGK